MWEFELDHRLKEFGDFLAEHLAEQTRRILFESDKPTEIFHIMNLVDDLPELSTKAQGDRERNPAMAEMIPKLIDDIEQGLGMSLFSVIREALAGPEGRERFEGLERAVAVWRQAAEQRWSCADG
jgi:hypothetical protein